MAGKKSKAQTEKAIQEWGGESPSLKEGALKKGHNQEGEGKHKVKEKIGKQ